MDIRKITKNISLSAATKVAKRLFNKAVRWENAEAAIKLAVNTMKDGISKIKQERSVKNVAVAKSSQSSVSSTESSTIDPAKEQKYVLSKAKK